MFLFTFALILGRVKNTMICVFIISLFHFCLNTKTNQKSQEDLRSFLLRKITDKAYRCMLFFTLQNALPLALQLALGNLRFYFLRKFCAEFKIDSLLKSWLEGKPFSVSIV